MSINNALIMAHKDLSDFLGNRWVLVVLAIYLVMVLSLIFTTSDQASRVELTDDRLFSMMLGWSEAIMSYGTIIGIMVGFSAIFNEKFSRALNTLMVKPVYRDTIINSKIIACISFLLAVFGLTIALYLSLILIMWGSSSARLLVLVFNRMPFIFFLSFFYVLIFMLLSMLISILVKRQSVALLFSILSYVLASSILPTASFAGNIYRVLGSNAYYYLVNLFPDFAFQMMIIQGLYNPAADVFNIIRTCWADFIIFPLYVAILIVI